MTPTALFLILVSTFAHAFWNYLGKRRSPSAAFFLAASIAAALFLSPILIANRHALAQMPALVWWMLLTTGAFQALYFVGLAGAYRAGDLSVAYPLARALPVLFIACITALLALGEPVTMFGYLGFAVVVVGCMLIPSAAFREIRPRSYWNLCCAFALLAALGTTGYTILDSEALGMLRSANLIKSSVLLPVFYLGIETITTVFWLSVWVAVSPSERAAAAQLKGNGWRYACLTGVMITVTYSLVLAAMTFATNVSLIVAFRQLSIPIGAGLGIVLQKEALLAPKAAGIALVAAGLVMVALA